MEEVFTVRQIVVATPRQDSMSTAVAIPRQDSMSTAVAIPRRDSMSTAVAIYPGGTA